MTFRTDHVHALAKVANGNFEPVEEFDWNAVYSALKELDAGWFSNCRLNRQRWQGALVS
jgi:hypothetical protein